ncbi:hypothetical protein AB1L30_13960 [Bremerella sp. JC817]|uniref:hypothetical protein n=1 Tax=Bremerella sp. JC817 TaxID=3231756 RepID=UPI003458AC0E
MSRESQDETCSAEVAPLAEQTIPTALTLYQTGYYVERKEPYYQFIALPDGQHWFLMQIGTQTAWWLAAVLTLASLGTIDRCCSRKPRDVT